MGDRVWVKTPIGRCTSPYPRGRVTGVISPQNVLVDGMPRHVRDLRPVIGLNTSESGSDSELSTRSARVITINEARSDPLKVNNTDTTDDTSADESFEEEVPLPRRSARLKRSVPVCHLCDHQIMGECGEIEGQSRGRADSQPPQTKRVRICLACAKGKSVGSGNGYSNSLPPRS